MATKDEYAQMSLYVYDAKALEENRPLEPAGWKRLQYEPAGFAGFSYGIFQRIGSDEVVIAYAGTNNIGDVLNGLAAGLGVASTQNGVWRATV